MQVLNNIVQNSYVKWPRKKVFNDENLESLIRIQEALQDDPGSMKKCR